MATLTSSQSHDVDDQAQALNGFRQFYEQLGCGRFHGRVWQVMMDAGFLLREASNRSLRQRFSPPPAHVSLAVPLAVGGGGGGGAPGRRAPVGGKTHPPSAARQPPGARRRCR